MAPHSSTLAWKIPWTEEPGRLQSMGSLRVGHNWATSLSLFTFMIGEGNGNPLQCSYLDNPRDGGAWWAAVYGLAQSRTRLNQLSSSNSSSKYKLWFPLFARSIYCTFLFLDCFDFAHGCILHYFNYYLPDFVTAICLGFIFGFSFWGICFNLTYAITNHCGIFVPDQRSSPETLEWEHWTQDPRLPEN